MKFQNTVMYGTFAITLLVYFLSIVVNFTLPKMSQKPNKSSVHIVKPQHIVMIVTPTVIPTATNTPVMIQKAQAAAPNDYCLNVPVLFYHHIEPSIQAKTEGHLTLNVDSGIFDQQMNYLVTHGYTTIKADQLVNALRTHAALPTKSILVTVDDGYKDVYQYAYPVFQKYHIVANLMIATGLVSGPDYVTWNQINEMLGSGLIFLIDHTWSHYAVGRGPHDKAKFEIETGKQQLEQNTGQHSVTIFAYPYGSYSTDAIQILAQDGFTGAFTTNPGTYQCASMIMTLRRTRIGNASLAYYGL